MCQMILEMKQRLLPTLGYKLWQPGTCPSQIILIKNIFFGLLIIQLASCASKSATHVKYYANLTGVVSPYLDYTPQGELTRQQADSIGRYYAFIYQKGKLTEINFFKRNQPSSQSYFRTHQVKYAYEKDLMSRSYYNETGNKAFMWRHYYQGGNIHREIFKLDHDLHKSSLLLEDTLGRQITSGEGVAKFTWTLLENGPVLQCHFDSLDQPTVFRKDIPFERLLLTIDNRGFSSSLTRVNALNQPEDHPIEGYATLKLFFDDHGNELGWSHWDEQMQLVNLPHEFGHSQWLYEKQYWSQELGVMKSFTERYFDKDGAKVQNEDSIHQVIYLLNTAGDLASLSYYNISLEAQNHLSQGFFKAEIQYDAIGNRLAIHKYDTQNQLVK